MGTISLKPEEVNDVAKKLDELADKLEKLMADEHSTMQVVASGRDEVSVRSADTMNQVRDSFDKASAQGINEIREISAVLRKQSGSLAAVAQELST